MNLDGTEGRRVGGLTADPSIGCAAAGGRESLLRSVG